MADAQMEICLLWGDWQVQQWWSCMYKTEWAGWMQAIGTVFAIIGAIWIAKNQSKTALKSIKDSQRIIEEKKINGILAVVRAARYHAANIGDAVSENSSVMLYNVYDKTIITGVVNALSVAPLYELGSPSAVAALLSIRDQFVFLGNAVEAHLAGPWKHKDLATTLESLRTPEYSTQLIRTLEDSTKLLAKNVKQRVEYIDKQCEIIESGLSS